MHMADTLVGKTCTPCKGGIPPLTPEEAERFHGQVPRWELRDEAKRIERTLKFRNFREALTFVEHVGELAESEGHHPDIRRSEEHTSELQSLRHLVCRL